MTLTLSPRRVQRVRFEPRRRNLQVARTERIGSSFIRITLTGPDLADFQSLSFDDHLKLVLAGADGQIVLRDFTPRAFDAAEHTLALEFALHEAGPASDWARQVRPGDTATVAGPRGSMVVPTDYDWHLLAGDASALPAIARRLEELPAQALALVLVEVPDAADVRSLATRARAQVQWVHSTPDFLAALRALQLPPGEGFAWCAGEAQAMKVARATLLDHHGHPLHAMRVSAYWKQGVADFHERLDA